MSETQTFDEVQGLRSGTCLGVGSMLESLSEQGQLRARIRVSYTDFDELTVKPFGELRSQLPLRCSFHTVVRVGFP